ncbi:HYC_CC_PP family protein [Hymenobacter rubripertinctus]|uniref:Uncharacterized protein n=1 Tax=Hymenobacter rubripertinctus TaxID=2029981 RepID=A0A418QVR1_9BACT|nr:hypothetical protein [Hymenobacter rubripertinctus]RIY09211.1 hypothetical protein D0T11_12265 [Hymenobacter rubripertinctus]
MKRFTGFFLLVAYLLASPGLVYSLHLCGEQVTGVSLRAGEEPPDCCAGRTKPTKGCCHNEQVSSTLKDVKLASAQLKLPAAVALPAPPALRLALRLALTYPAEEPLTRGAATAAPPPRCPAYVRGHAFLI